MNTFRSGKRKHVIDSPALNSFQSQITREFEEQFVIFILFIMSILSEFSGRDKQFYSLS